MFCVGGRPDLLGGSCRSGLRLVADVFSVGLAALSTGFLIAVVRINGF